MCGDFKYEKENIELRRARVLELVAQGLSQKEIAEKVASSASTVSLDLQYLRETAKSNIQNHIEERIPMQYEECQAGLKFILRKTYEMVDKATKPHEAISAMALAVDIYGKLMDLSTNGAILEKTVKWLEDRKKILPTPEEQKQIDKILGGTSTTTTTAEDDEDFKEKEQEEG